MRCRILQPCEVDLDTLGVTSKTRAPWDFTVPNAAAALVPNMPTPQGIELGRELARIVDHEEQKQLVIFPDQHPRCSDCAARAGTRPNGCEETLMDFIKCAVEGVPFMCHKGVPAGEEPSKYCRGWLILQHTSDTRADLSIGQQLGRHLPVTR